MREVNISGLDLNLVPPLDALLRRRNVTHAGADVGLSQPAMSRALRRLREVLGDPLLVRTRQGYVLTPRAQAIQPQLAGALSHLHGVFERQTFDPGAEHRIVRLAAADADTVLIIPGVKARLAVEAPGVDVRVEAYRADMANRLESGALDFAFAISGVQMPAGAHSEAIVEDRLALVMRRAHPAAARAWSIADYGDYEHVGVAVLGDGRSEIDAVLAAAGVTRRVSLVTPHFMAALAAVAATDMVTTVSALLARRFAAAFDLVLQEPPLGDNRFQRTLVWSPVRASDPLLVWFRSVVRQVAEDCGAETRDGE